MEKLSLKFSSYAPMSDRDTEDGVKMKISQYKARTLRGEATALRSLKLIIINLSATVFLRVFLAPR